MQRLSADVSSVRVGPLGVGTVISILFCTMVTGCFGADLSNNEYPEVGVVWSEMGSANGVPATPVAPGGQMNQVAIYHRATATEWHERPGSGTFLNANWVLTAAHCTRYGVLHNGGFVEPSEMAVSALLSPGLISVTGNPPPGALVPIRIVRHPIYDVALLQVASAGFGSVGLYSNQTSNHLNQEIRCYGYGQADCSPETDSSPGAGILRTALFGVQGAFWLGDPYRPAFSEVAYGINNSLVSVTNGDSGGACFIGVNNGAGEVLELTGIHITGQICGTGYDLSSHSFRDWVRHTMFGTPFLTAVVSPLL